MTDLTIWSDSILFPKHRFLCVLSFIQVYIYVAFSLLPEGNSFILALQTFMETSSLGEFNTRLQILAAFLEEMNQRGIYSESESECTRINGIARIRKRAVSRN